MSTRRSGGAKARKRGRDARPSADRFAPAPHFTADGNVPRIQAAEAAAERGAPIVGLVFDGGVLLGARYDPMGGEPLPAFLGSNTSDLRGGKILRLGPRLAVVGVGLMGDIAAVGRHLRGQNLPSTQAAVDCLGALFWERTVRDDARILGTFLLLGSTLDDDPRLFQFSPSGSVHEYVAWARGRGTAPVRRRLSEAYRPGSQAHAEKVALEALNQPTTYEWVIVKRGPAR